MIFIVITIIIIFEQYINNLFIIDDFIEYILLPSINIVDVLLNVLKNNMFDYLLLITMTITTINITNIATNINNINITNITNITTTTTPSTSIYPNPVALKKHQLTNHLDINSHKLIL